MWIWASGIHLLDDLIDLNRRAAMWADPQAQEQNNEKPEGDELHYWDRFSYWQTRARATKDLHIAP